MGRVRPDAGEVQRALEEGGVPRHHEEVRDEVAEQVDKPERLHHEPQLRPVRVDHLSRHQ